MSNRALLNKALLVSSIFLGFSLQAQAGATNIELDCKSSSGRTTLKGNVPGDFAEFGVEFVIDGAKVEYFDRIVQQLPFPTETNAMIEVSDALSRNNKNFGFVVKSQDQSATLLRFQAVPRSVQFQRTRNGSTAKFNAVVQGMDPRQEGATSPEITMSCSYAYEI